MYDFMAFDIYIRLKEKVLE